MEVEFIMVDFFSTHNFIKKITKIKMNGLLRTIIWEGRRRKVVNYVWNNKG